MSKILAFVFIVAGFGIILTYQNCGQPNNVNKTPQGSVTITGTVEKSTLDGCNTLIVSDEDPNSKFIPFGVSSDTFKNGERVKIQGSFPNDVYSTCMAGVILRVEKLEKVQNNVQMSQPFIP
ncbi:MAG: hypothetical protein IPM57_11895 [Oligoflexia bacterium]|nr:hypothetical protein [Oligoflexia bacterium]